MRTLLVGLLVAASAQASILSITARMQFPIDVSNISSYDLEFGYDQTYLSYIGVTWAPYLGTPGLLATTSLTFDGPPASALVGVTPTTQGIRFSEHSVLNAAQLQALQGTSLLDLATFDFDILQTGSYLVHSDAGALGTRGDGSSFVVDPASSILSFTAGVPQTAYITFGATPEPATYILIVIPLLAGMVVRRRRRS